MRFLSLWVTFCLLTFTVFPQRYSFINYSTSDGLPQSQVNALAQDSLGYLWVGTFGGLARFNGTTFVNYSKLDGLLNNRVTFLEFLGGKLFVGHDNGISILDANDNFRTFSFPENTTPSNVTGITKFNETIFVSTNGQGLFALRSEELQHMAKTPQRIRALLNTQGDGLFIASREGVFNMNNQGKVQKISVFPDESFSGLAYSEEQLYVTSYDGNAYKYDLASKEIVRFFSDENFRCRAITISQDDEVWINAGSGAVKIDQDERIVLDQNSGLPINDISLVFCDRERNVWLGTGGKGLLKFSGELFTHYNLKSGLPSELIISTLEDDQGNLWLSSYDEGVFVLNPESNEIIQKRLPINEVVWSTARMNKELFFGSIYGLYVFSNNKWRIYYDTDGLPSNKITGLFAHKSGKLYIGTGQGVAVYQNGEIKALNDAKEAVNNARGFTEDDFGIYVAAQSGVFQIDKITDSLRLIASFEGALNCMLLDQFNNLWVGSENGLYKRNEGVFELMLLADRKGSEYINFLVEDKDDIYIGTNNGLFRYEFMSNKTMHFGINAGLVDLETNLNSAFKDSEGNLWFGTVAGLMKMNLNAVSFDQNEGIKPIIHLLSILVNFEELRLMDEKEENNAALTVLSHNKNNISFNFDAIYLSNPKGIYFSYFLDGFSEGWSPISNIRNINFTNLPPNEYKLIIRCFTPNNEVYQTELTFPFLILPPFYNTWWFYALMVLLFVGALFTLDRFRNIRNERISYQEKLEYKSKMLQLEQQSLNASMNRHFIFNALNSIQFYINSSDKQSANRYLTRFAKLIRKNLDSSNQKNGMVSLADELERLQLYIDLETMRFRNKFDFDLVLDDEVETERLIVPAMFLQPFVENSIIHGVLPLKNKKGIIQIKIANHLDHIRIEIFDNGVGIDRSISLKDNVLDDHESQGMLITKGRIELLQQISARAIELIGPHQINESDHSVKGTLVVFKILKQYLD